MNPPCARCGKSVYPVEKLISLDQTWHKNCFNCEVCKITLNMKTYRGLNKKPYCQTHYPKIGFTAVADTPESKRIAENTKNFSNTQYHAEAEKIRDKFTAVADDPVTQRATAATKARMNYDQRGQEEESSSASSGYGGGYEQQQQQAPSSYSAPVSQQRSAPPPPPEPEAEPSEPAWVAVYAYTATDTDEVSFVEGDEAINVTIIDDGWIQGTIKRTGESGLLPSNYFSPPQ